MNHIKNIDHLSPQYFPGAISYPGFPEKDTPIEGCYTMLNIFTDKEYNEPGIHEDNEGFYVIGGTGKIMIAEEEFDISQGSCILVPAGVPHAIKKTGDEELTIFIYHFAK